MSAMPFAAGSLVGLTLIGVLVLISLSISAMFLLWAARLVGVENRSFGKALATIFIGGIASFLLGALLSVASPLGTGAGILLGFVISALVMMGIFDTTFSKALAANVIAWVLSIAVTVGIAILMAFILPFVAAGAA